MVKNIEDVIVRLSGIDGDREFLLRELKVIEAELLERSEAFSIRNLDDDGSGNLRLEIIAKEKEIIDGAIKEEEVKKEILDEIEPKPELELIEETSIEEPVQPEPVKVEPKIATTEIKTESPKPKRARTKKATNE